MSYQRPQFQILSSRLAEPRRFIQVVAGPRQVGKTTLVQQVCEGVGLPVQYSSADEPTLRGPEWIAQQWEVARLKQTSLGALRCWFWMRSRKSPVGPRRLSVKKGTLPFNAVVGPS